MSPAKEIAHLRERLRYLEGLVRKEQHQPETRREGCALPELGDAVIEREALLAEAEGIAQLGSWFWDTDSEQVRWSDGLFKVLGFEPGSVEVSVDLFLQCIHPGDRSLFVKANRTFTAADSSLPNGMLPRMQLRVCRPDGEMRLVELSGRVVLNQDGRPRRLVGTVHDLTDNRATVSALEEASEILRMANQIQGLATWRWNVANGEVRWSEEMYVLLGVERSTHPSLPAMLDALHPEDRSRARFCTKASHLPTNGEPLELRFLRPDGTTCYAVSSFGSFEAAGPEYQKLVVGILVDVSERHALEEELLRARKMEALGRMAGGVAHDVNNYLTVTMGNADLLRASIPDSDTSLQTMVNEILTASERCQSMTRRLLDFGRRSKASPRKLDIAALLRARAGMLRCLAGPQVELRLELDSAPVVNIDETHFEQLLMNLVTNARDAMPDGGVLSLRCRTEGAGEKAWALVEVKDEGIGMDEKTKDRLFEPFFTTKELGRGSGLGLPTVYAIVQQHKGRIQIESELGQGCLVSLRFPLVQATDAPSS